MSAGNIHVKAIFDYSSGHDDDLPFSIGQIISITEDDDEEWYTGEYIDDNGTKQEGIFPRNFVEKYEPTAPPRPTRRAKKEPEPAVLEEGPIGVVASPTPMSPKIEEEAPAPPSPPAPVEMPARPASPPAAPVPEPAKSPEPVAKDPAAKPKPGPPPVAAKSGSIRDRIAAFNKPGAAPVTPFKPSSLNYKKPFVPPPPSRDAYVPPPRAEPPARMYVREEEADPNNDEPDIQETAINAAPVASASRDSASTEDQPKPTTLQERIAILQKQQAEAAQRHADNIAKKEKPKRPQRKRAESSETSQAPDVERSVTLERHDTEDSEYRTSLDEPRVAAPARRKASSDHPINDGNDADMSGGGDTTEGVEELTEREDNDDKPQPVPRRSEDQEERAVEDEDEGEDEEEDPEVRRKEELRARMAKMSGGMGMPGMFMPMGGPPAPKKKKPSVSKDEGPSGTTEAPSPAARAAPPVPTMMTLPGMSTRQSSEQSRDEPSEPAPAARPPPPAPPGRQSSIEEEPARYEDDDPTPPPHSPASPPPVPSGRPAPPPVPTAAPAPPPRPTSPMKSPSAGSESDDELSEQARPAALAETQAQATPVMRSPPPPPPILPSPTLPTSPRFSALPPPVPRSEDGGPTSPTSPGRPVASKRNSRPPPPIPGVAAPALPPAHTRPPPPPPPGQGSESGADNVAIPTRPPPRAVDEEEDATEYEGDYDTDIASSAPHKDALKATSREAPYDEDFTHFGSPVADDGGTTPPALPKTVPPPVPGQTAHAARPSVDFPRSAPPPPPLTKDPESTASYQSHGPRISTMGGSGSVSYGDEGLPEVLSSPTSPDRKVLPTGPPPSRPRQSMDAVGALSRASIDVGPPSMSTDTGFIAEDVDVALQTGWWQQSSQIPPVLQNRRDIVYEAEESTSTNRGAKTVITRTISVLFIDYSKTIITVHYDPYDPSDVQIDQHQEPPPRSLRQDQLENSYDRFGRAIADMASSKKESVVGDGTPQGLIHELLRPFKDALRPVGTRAYGALVYANMANASTLLHDEIRPGDVISFRNTRFQGKHGAMHAKYSAEVGKPDHVGVVAEWDGTKRKVRAWEQGRESRKVKMESFKLDDLRSGEIKVWRVMPRSWVGWSTKH